VSVLLFSCEVAHPKAGAAAKALRKAEREFRAALRLGERELSLLLVSDRAIRRLNRAHRGKDEATDVLSFPQEEPLQAARAKGPIGDVVISLHTALRQAAAGGWALSRELRRLLAHGLLHCLGHDHARPAEARKMARAERRLLGEAGMVGASLSQARAVRGTHSPRTHPPKAPARRRL
jgi:probable rRNA maturation factor